MTATVTLCDECGVWPLDRDADQFCGWCGSPLLELALLRPDGGRLDPPRLYLAPGQAAQELILRQRGSLARTTPSVRRGDGTPCELEPLARPGDHRLRIALTDLPAPAEGRPVELPLVIDCAGAEPVNITLMLWPLPEIAVAVDPARLQQLDQRGLSAAFLDARASTERLVVRLTSHGAPLVPRRVGVRVVSQREPLWDHGGTVLTETLKVELADRDREVGLDRELPIAIERRGSWPRGEQRVLGLVLRFDGLEDWELPIQLTQLRRIGGELQPPTCEFDKVYIGQVERRHAHLANGDDFELHVREIHADQPWLRVAEYAPGARAEDLRPLRLPIVLPPATSDRPGQGIDLTVLVDTTHPAFPPVHQGELPGMVHFELDAVPGRRSYAVRIGRIARAESLARTGYLAIDFGTTNTCCALKLEGREVEVIPFGADGRQTVPSVLFFEDLSDPKRPRYRVGNAALAQAKLRSERSLERNFKRRIGLDLKDRVIDPEGRTAHYLPEELTAFFLKEVLREVREHLAGRGTPIEIDSIFFTFPVLFSPRQVEILAQVFRDLGVREVRPAIDEASSGAVEYVHSWANAAFKAHLDAGGGPEVRREHVLNYDFGGGTIDIALLEVISDYDQRLVTSTPVGVTGLYRFGGEDITVLVREMIVRRIEHAMRRRHPRFALPHGDLSDPPGLYEPKKQNNARLSFLAEKVKIAIFSAGSYVIHPTDPDLDHLWVDKGDGAGLEQVDATTRPLFGELDAQEARIVLRTEEVERVIRPHVEGSIERAYNLWRFSAGQAGRPQALSRVLLTGRSSSIPLVRRLMLERLGIDEDRIVHEPERAKQVVAQGACYYRRQENVMVSGLRFLMGDVDRRLLIPIGIEMVDFSESVFHTIFANGLEMSQRQTATGQTRYHAEHSLTFGLAGPIASLKVFRSLDYVDPITSGGKNLIARFEFRADDPFFADWTPVERQSFAVRFQLWKATEGGEHTVEVVVSHPRSGTEKVFTSVFHDDLLATVGDNEEARGLLLLDELDALPDRDAARPASGEWSTEEWK